MASAVAGSVADLTGGGARGIGVDVMLCTFRRDHVCRTLESLDALSLPDGVRLRVLVADNDDTPSAREAVRACAERLSTETVYLHAPARSISVARNACLDASGADWIALIDDDETADPGWLRAHLACVSRSGADAAFGPARAVYDARAPEWMRRQDHHSNIPERRNGIVRTGHTCNALLRWRGTAWQSERFDLSRGRSGGEDTEFFFRLHRLGAKYDIATDALVYERVAPNRLSYDWLRERRFRMGQSYASSADGFAARAGLFATAALKAAFCQAMALAHAPGSGGTRYRWRLRGALHAGVCSGCLSARQKQIYGADENPG